MTDGYTQLAEEWLNNLSLEDPDAYGDALDAIDFIFQQPDMARRAAHGVRFVSVIGYATPIPGSSPTEYVYWRRDDDGQPVILGGGRPSRA